MIYVTYSLAGLLVLSIFSTFVYRKLYKRESRLRVEDNGKMMGDFIESRAEKVRKRKLEVLKFEDPTTGKPWLPTLDWERVEGLPSFARYIVRAPIPGQLLEGKDPGEKITEFKIDFHDLEDYAVHFMKGPYLRSRASQFHCLLRKVVEASAPWNIRKHAARIHKSKSPDKKSGDDEIKSLGASA